MIVMHSQSLLSGQVRKMYALKGHGVPNSLLCHLFDTGRAWLHHQQQQCSSSSSNNNIKFNEKTVSSSPSAVQMSFSNIPGTTLLNQKNIRFTNAHGATSASSLPTKWEHDLEMYMVVMDRIGSRLASIALTSSLASSQSQCSNINNGNNNTAKDVIDFNAKKSMRDDCNLFSGENTTLGTGSVITPADLHQWNVTITKGDSLPMSLLPRNGNSMGGTSGERAGGDNNSTPILTVEWVPKTKNNCRVLLRLQNEGVGGSACISQSNSAKGGRRNGGSNTKKVLMRDPISLVFDGMYTMDSSSSS